MEVRPIPPSSGTLFFWQRVCVPSYILSIRDGSNSNIFFVKNEKGPRTRWDSLLALTHQNGAAKAPSFRTVPIQRRRLFSLKKNIASMVFLHPFRQKNTQNASADVPKRRRERADRRDEATLAPPFFVNEKTSKKEGNTRNCKRA